MSVLGGSPGHRPPGPWVLQLAMAVSLVTELPSQLPDLSFFYEPRALLQADSIHVADSLEAPTQGVFSAAALSPHAGSTLVPQGRPRQRGTPHRQVAALTLSTWLKAMKQESGRASTLSRPRASAYRWVQECPYPPWPLLLPP